MPMVRLQTSTSGFGQEPTVEVALQFEQPWSGPPLLNGRFPASEFPVALPQRGHVRTIDVPITMVDNRLVLSRCT